MSRYKCVTRKSVVWTFAVLIVIPVTLFFIRTASCEQKPMTLNPTTVTKPPETAPGTPNQPASNVPTKMKVDMITVLKNQLKQCEADKQQLDKDNDVLIKKNSDLQKQNAALIQQKALMQKQLDACTKVGGSSVKSYCVSSTVSRNTAGAITNCASTGYLCDPVSGLCRTNCSATDGQCDHANGFFCDRPSGRCVK